MKILIIYDSVFGNTEQIAQAIYAALSSHEEVEVIRVSDVKPEQLTGLNLLIVGSPTQRFRPTAAINNLLKRIAKNGLKGVKIAAFDTRLTMSNIQRTPILAFFVRLFGYAAKPISVKLKKKGGESIISPDGFFVEEIKGPLKAGELQRAADWAKQIITIQKNAHDNDNG
jgi:flavodoxin